MTLIEFIEQHLGTATSSTLIFWCIALLAISVAMYVVRKLISIALFVGIAYAGWAVWHDPALLSKAQDTIMIFVKDLQDGRVADAFRETREHVTGYIKQENGQ